ncbi:MAG: NAD(P)-dependent oxidoreductase, partial [Muribaculaceae bacterium]|nr:NAD(P)-dependent oxidoreductase [Muribaculaceae bacterium]
QCKIEPCKSSGFPSPGVRAAYSVLDKTKFKTTFDIQIPYWKDSLKTCIKNLKEHEA